MHMTEQEKKERRERLSREVGDRIRRHREKAGLTRENLSEAVGISTQYVSDIERGRKCMSFTIFMDLARVLGVSMDALACGNVKEDPALEQLMECLRAMRPVDREIVADIILSTAQVVASMKPKDCREG